MRKRDAQSILGEAKRSGTKILAARGVPGREVLELSRGCFSEDVWAPGKEGLFNYGGADPMQGLDSLRELISPFMRLPAEQMVAWGTSVLDLLGFWLQQYMYGGLYDVFGPLNDKKPALLMPLICYDRWVQIAMKRGYRIIPVRPAENGDLDVDFIRDKVKNDPSIVGMVCTTRLINPTGHTLSFECIRELVRIKPAFRGFTIFEDDAYWRHTFDGSEPGELDLIKEAGSTEFPGYVIRLISLSKVLAPGSSPSLFGVSDHHLIDVWSAVAANTRGFSPPKVQQAQVVQFFDGKPDLIADHMAAIGKIHKPRFAAVEGAFERYFAGLDARLDVSPIGGYFGLLRVKNAKETIRLAAEAGVQCTPWGSTSAHCTYHGIQRRGSKLEAVYEFSDPSDSQIRLCPTAMTPAEIDHFMRILAAAATLAARA